MLLEAAEPLLRDRRMVLDVIGEGPLSAPLREFVATRGLEDRVTFHGWVEHADVSRIAGRSSVLAFPSIREFGGGVVLEAMAMGVVPLIVDYAGPGELVDDETGFKIPIGPRDGIVAGFRAKLEEIAAAPEQLDSKGRAGRSRVERLFTWGAKAKQISLIYEWVLRGDVEKPRFFGG